MFSKNPPQQRSADGLALTGAVLYGGRPGNRGGAVEGAGEAVGAAVVGLVVVPGTGVARHQARTGEAACQTGN